MAQLFIVTTPQNSGDGTPLATAFNYVNSNFSELYSRAQATPPASLTGTAADQPGWYASDSTYFYYCFGTYDGINPIWAQISNSNNTYGNAQVATFLASFGANTVSTTGNITAGNVITNHVVTTAGDLTLAPVGNVSVANVWINNLADPVTAQDAATKNYVDSQLSSGELTFADDTGNTYVTQPGDTITFNQTADQTQVTVGNANITIGLADNVTISGTITAQGIAGQSGNLTLSANVAEAWSTWRINTDSVDYAGPNNSALVVPVSDATHTNEIFFQGVGGNAQMFWAGANNDPFSNAFNIVSELGNIQLYTVDRASGLHELNFDTDGNLTVTGNITAAGSIGGSYVFGNGSFLTGLSGTYGNADVVAYGEAGWSGNIIPSANVTYSLGNSTNWWSTAWFGANTIYIGGVGVSAANSALTVGGNPVITANATGTSSVTGNTAVTGNVSGGNLLTGGVVSATGNVRGGNINTGGAVSATGNISGSYILGNGSQLVGVQATGIGTLASLSVSGTTTTGNLNTGGQVSATGNISGGNLYIGGSATVAGNLQVQGNVTFINSNVITTNDLYLELANNQSTYANINGAGLAVGPAGSALTYWQYNTVANAWTTNVAVSAAGTVSGTSLIGTIATASQTNITAIGTLATLSVTGNITGGGNIVFNNASSNLTVHDGFFGGVVSATGNVRGGNVNTIGLVTATGNVHGGNILTGGAVSAGGNITGGYILGNGSQLTGLPATYGNSNVATFMAAFGSNTISTTGNIDAGYLFGNGSQLTGIAASYGNSNVATFMAAFGSNTISTTGNVTSSSLGVGTAATGTAGEIRATNNITAYYSSDARLKENVQNIADPVAKLMRLNGVEFDWRQDYIDSHGGEDGYFVRRHDIGVIAQELEAVLPELVVDRADGYKAVKYDRIIALLIEAVKAQQHQIDELKRR